MFKKNNDPERKNLINDIKKYSELFETNNPNFAEKFKKIRKKFISLLNSSDSESIFLLIELVSEISKQIKFEASLDGVKIPSLFHKKTDNAREIVYKNLDDLNIDNETKNIIKEKLDKIMDKNGEVGNISIIIDEEDDDDDEEPSTSGGIGLIDRKKSQSDPMSFDGWYQRKLNMVVSEKIITINDTFFNILVNQRETMINNKDDVKLLCRPSNDELYVNLRDFIKNNKRYLQLNFVFDFCSCPVEIFRFENWGNIGVMDEFSTKRFHECTNNIFANGITEFTFSFNKYPSDGYVGYVTDRKKVDKQEGWFTNDGIRVNDENKKMDGGIKEV